MLFETELTRIYSDNPFFAGYLSCMLEDLQGSESDEACTEERDQRDVGSIYTLPTETWAKALADCEEFKRVANRAGAFDEAAALMGLEHLGSDFHMTRVGRGTGYWDRDKLNVKGDNVPNLGTALSEAVELFRNEGGYFGDDGQVYL